MAPRQQERGSMERQLSREASRAKIVIRILYYLKCVGFGGYNKDVRDRKRESSGGCVTNVILYVLLK